MEKRALADAVPTLLRRWARRLASLPAAENLVDSHFVHRLRDRFYRISAQDLLSVTSALDRARVEWWITGGWGVDLLLGEQTRPHGDLDIWVEAASDGEERSVAALNTLGYKVATRRAVSGRRFPIRSVLRNRSGKIIDLIMVTAKAEAGYPALTSNATAVGTLSVREQEHRVRCASATEQILAHAGYKPREVDIQDVRLLCAQSGIELPPAYARFEPESGRQLTARGRAVLSEIISRVRGISALLFLVPEAQPVFDSVGGGTPGGIPAHITVLYPFVPPYRINDRTLAAISRIAATTDQFQVTAASTGHYELTTFLTVELEEPIRALTRRCFAEWPAHPPYGQADRDVPPHITLADGVLPAEVADTIDPHLPIEIDVQELVLMTRRWSGRWQVQERFRLGVSEV